NYDTSILGIEGRMGDGQVSFLGEIWNQELTINVLIERMIEANSTQIVSCYRDGVTMEGVKIPVESARWHVRGMRDVPIHGIGETQKAIVANDTFCIHFFPLTATIK
ncbi:MAG: hypothetical protein NTV46_19145, partial [Verrucomicrobia bacterium]|nr:hypothetical protein [Verrucomicrobiota bacterium]